MTIEEYSKLPDRIRSVAGRLVGDSRKELIAIAALIVKSAPDLLKPCYSGTFKRRIYRVPAEKVALPSILPGGGSRAVNANRNNEERMDESIALVTAAVDALKKLYDWDSLGARAKIRLLQIETLNMRGAEISSQTLYQEWIKDIWQPRPVLDRPRKIKPVESRS